MAPKPLRVLTLILILALLAACGGGGAASPTAAPGGGETAPEGEAPAGEEQASEEPTEAPAAEEPAEEEPAASGDKVQIRLATWAGVDEAKELQEVIDQVNAEAEGFEIISEPSPQDYYTKLQTAVAGGGGPDLFWLSQEYIAGYASRGAILDITDSLAGDDTPAADVDDYFPGVFQTVRYQDKIYGLPWIAQPVILYYNPALFEAAGIDPPNEDWTWDDFREAAAAITNPEEGVYGTTFNSWPPIHMFIWQAGGEVISEDLQTSPIDSPEAVEAAQFYADIIYNEEYAPSAATIAEQGFGEMAKAGKIGMFFGGAADDLDYAHTKDPANAELRAALVPKGPAGNRTTFAWSAATVINAGTANPDMAYEALVALTEGIHHWKVLAPRQSLANAETIVASVPEKEASAEVIVQAAQDMRSFRIVPRHQEWDDLFWRTFQDPLFQDQGTAEELAAQARPQLEAVLP